MRIAHLSDSHINLKYHPQHLVRLQRVLEDALRRDADHIVITGDLTSNADARDLRTVRRLFESLGILRSSKLTVVVGNHDLYGAPHLADDVLSFPERCHKLDYAEKLAIFQDHFAELFVDTITKNPAGYPFLKRVKDVCLLGFNSIAEYSTLQNPVGSNGIVAAAAQEEARSLADHHAWQTARARIALLHHHTFRPKDVSHLEIADGISKSGIASRLEQLTLKLYGKRQLFRLFKSLGVDLILHGHIHFTGAYKREGIRCLNGGGAVYPVVRGVGLFYNLIEIHGSRIETDAIRVGTKLRMRIREHNPSVTFAA